MLEHQIKIFVVDRRNIQVFVDIGEKRQKLGVSYFSY